MKKILVILTVIIIGIGACNMMNSGPSKEEMIEVLKSDEAIKAIEQAMRNREEKALTSEGVIKSYYIRYDSVKWEARGAIEVKILINNDENLYFIYTIKKVNNIYEISSSTNSRSLEELLEEYR